MAVHEIIPSSNVLAVDIRDTLGESTNALDKLFLSQNINMFALRKPVRLPELFPNMSNEEWCKGIGLNYGIGVPAPTTLDGLSASVWTYERPRGGTSEPFRLQDFAGYRRSCPTPYYNCPAEMYINKDQQNNVVIQCYPNSESLTVGFDKYSKFLGHPDGVGGKFYAAIHVKDSSNDGGYVKTYEAPISGSDQPIDFNFEGLPAKYRQGRLTVVCFFASKMLTSWTSANSLPLGFLCYGGYGRVSYETYVTTFVFPPELIASLDREYVFVDSTTWVNVIVRNTRTDGKYINLSDGIYPTKAKLDYDVTSATGDYASASGQYFDVVSGSPNLAPGASCTIRFDRMLGYTENGQQAFPPSGFVGWCYASLYYGRRNDTPGLESTALININIKLTASM